MSFFVVPSRSLYKYEIPFRITFATSTDFGKLCFYFDLSWGIFRFPLWFLFTLCFSSMLFNFYLVMLYPVFFFFAIINSIFSTLWSERNAWYNFYPPFCCWGLFCNLVCDLSWRMLHVHFKRICILLFLNVMFCNSHLNATCLLCYLRPLFPYWISVWIPCPLLSVLC